MFYLVYSVFDVILKCTTFGKGRPHMYRVEPNITVLILKLFLKIK